MDDLQDFYKEIIGGFLEDGLEAELDDELGYSKYDYRNKETDNSRNGYSEKTMKTSFGDVTVDVPHDRKISSSFALTGMKGFPEAINAIYPKTEIQQCIIHQIRNSTQYVSYKFQPSAPEGNKGKIHIPDRRQPPKNAVSGDDGHNEKMDRPSPGQA